MNNGNGINKQTINMILYFMIVLPLAALYGITIMAIGIRYMGC